MGNIQKTITILISAITAVVGSLVPVRITNNALPATQVRQADGIARDTATPTTYVPPGSISLPNRPGEVFLTLHRRPSKPMICATFVTFSDGIMMPGVSSNHMTDTETLQECYRFVWENISGIARCGQSDGDEGRTWDSMFVALVPMEKYLDYRNIRKTVDMQKEFVMEQRCLAVH